MASAGDDGYVKVFLIFLVSFSVKKKTIKPSHLCMNASKKIWDLRAGRLLSELREHTAAVTEVVFHPHEFLLASGAADRRVLFWDLENFTLVSNSDPETSGIRFVDFLTKLFVHTANGKYLHFNLYFLDRFIFIRRVNVYSVQLKMD